MQERRDSIKLQSQHISQKISLRRKQLCTLHDLKYRFQCQSPNCETQYLCGDQQCIQNHFHNGILTLTRFNAEHYRNKFESIQKSMNNSEKINIELTSIKQIVQQFRISITEIFKDLQIFQNNCEDVKTDIQQTNFLNYIDKYDQILNLQEKIRSNIEKLQLRINIQEQTKDIHYFSMKSKLEYYLKSQIEGFSWDTCKDIWSHKSGKSCEKFHEKLQGKSNLLFLFIGEKNLIGSYFPDAYPTIQQKTIKSINSFIFYHSGEDSTEFIKFKANPDSQHHLQISQKLIICQGNTPSFGDGVRTFARNLDSIDFYLPSISYLSSSNSQESQTYSGRLKPKSVLVLQINKKIN